MENIEELMILRSLEESLRQARETLLMDIAPEPCNCTSSPTRKVFRCPEAFQIAMSLTQLDSIRSRGKHNASY